ncbi:MAG: gluconate 2-dehydrogenase subunit 3 family protein [Proteobacteria bacterium]|nr:gluconate 2-dehydrogenase subunit 3 family protein [Pseudomonadota bacterium]MBU1717174.1 gluconate 2-dehydrogenase subunit 3 family protein [Pseudomonadota bacterium]
MVNISRLIFNEWENELPLSLVTKHSRRQFIQRLTHLSVFAAGLPVIIKTKSVRAADCSPDLIKTNEPWQTIIAVQNHLFPAGPKSPGAIEIKAAEYLQIILAAPDMDPEECQFIINGPQRINALATEMYQKKFIALEDGAREKVLRRIEKNMAGRNWLISILSYLFEALLSDPVYGGNPAGIGWQWLNHQPGYPRPPQNKKYWMLK